MIEAEFGENYKIIISSASVDLGSWASINQVKYKNYVNEKVQKNVGQNRVLKKQEVKFY